VVARLRQDRREDGAHSLIVDPPDGKIPPQTPRGRRARPRARRPREHGPADSYENRSLQERCITRGLPEVILPGRTTTTCRSCRRRGYVVLFTEMIHDARVVPMDGGRTTAEPAVVDGRFARRWEGDTLVVDTTNFTDRTTSAAPARTCIWSNASRASTRHDRLPLHRRGSDDLDEAVDGRVSDREDRRADLRVRVPRGNYGLRDILTGAPLRREGRRQRPRERRMTC
jgi:hypothetical protein